MKTPPNFDRIAKPYKRLEYLTMGRLLEQTRLSLLPRLLEAQSALILGDGDGRFLLHLLAANATVRCTAVDISASMLRLLRERCAPYAGRLSTRQCDALRFTPPENTRYDLVVTHFFLDCLTQAEVDELIARLLPSLSPSSLWIVSDFRIPAGRMRLPARILVRSLYLAFRLLTGLRTTRLPDHRASLSAAGFACIERRLFGAGILTSELWQRIDHAPKDRP